MNARRVGARFFKIGMVIGFALLICTNLTPFSVDAQNTINQPVAEINAGAVINQVQWSPTGEALATATSDGLRLYTPSLQLLTQVHPGHDIHSLSWNPNGLQLAITFQDSIEIWSWSAVSNSLTFSATLTRSAEALAVFWSPDGTRLASIEKVQPSTNQLLETPDLEIGIILIWDTSTFQLQRVMSGSFLFDLSHTLGDILDWKPDREPILAGVGNRAHYDSNTDMIADSSLIIYVLDASTGTTIKDIPIHGPYALSVAWQPPAGYSIAVGSDLGVELYNASTGAFERPLPSQSFDVQSLTWTGDGRFIASDGSVGDTVQDSAASYFQTSEPVLSNDWNPHFSRLVISAGRGELSVENPGLIPGFNFMPIANAGADRTITATIGISGQTTLDGSGSSDSDGNIVTYSWRENGSEIATGVNLQVTLNVGTHTITLAVTDNDGSTSTDEVVITINASAATPPAKTSGDVVSVAWSSDGGKLAYGGADGTVQIVQAPSIEQTSTPDAKTSGDNGSAVIAMGVK